MCFLFVFNLSFLCCLEAASRSFSTSRSFSPPPSLFLITRSIAHHFDNPLNNFELEITFFPSVASNNIFNVSRKKPNYRLWTFSSKSCYCPQSINSYSSALIGMLNWILNTEHLHYIDSPWTHSLQFLFITSIRNGHKGKWSHCTLFQWCSQLPHAWNAKRDSHVSLPVRVRNNFPNWFNVYIGRSGCVFICLCLCMWNVIGTRIDNKTLLSSDFIPKVLRSVSSISNYYTEQHMHNKCPYD